MAITVLSKKPQAIVGPIVSDISSIAGNDVVLATAFYTAGALHAIDIDAKQLRLFVRLSFPDWVMGSSDPIALRTFIERHEQRGIQVSLFTSLTAHAKIYSGQNGYLIGSANLSSRALSGSAAEVLWFESDAVRKKAMEAAIEAYSKGFTLCSLAHLDTYIYVNKEKVLDLVKKIPREMLLYAHNRFPAGIVRPPRFGEYDEFLQWLMDNPSPAAKEIFERAHGKLHLNGHIRQAFFGLRQFFIGFPSTMRYFIKVDPDSYSFSGDNQTVSKFVTFITRYACDEELFSPEKWKTYLPKSVGGNQTKGGATLGNLNRMFPLLAKYLNTKIGIML